MPAKGLKPAVSKLCLEKHQSRSNRGAAMQIFKELEDRPDRHKLLFVLSDNGERAQLFASWVVVFKRANEGGQKAP